jgi:hypothetical protein
MMSSHHDSYVASGNSPTAQAQPRSCDFLVENHFTLFLIFPCTEIANTWVEENLPPDHLTFGRGIVIEARYFWPILEGIQIDGLTAVPR